MRRTSRARDVERDRERERERERETGATARAIVERGRTNDRASHRIEHHNHDDDASSVGDARANDRRAPRTRLSRVLLLSRASTDARARER